MTGKALRKTPRAWRESYLPVLTWLAPPRTMTLQTLASRDGLDRLVPVVASNLSIDLRTAALTLLHYAAGAVAGILAGPLAIDALTLSASADQIGFVLDQDGSLSALWAGPGIQFERGSNASKLGACVGDLLLPVARAVQLHEKLRPRVVEAIVFDAMYRSCRRLALAHSQQVDSSWVLDLLAGMGQPRPGFYRTFEVHPDDGPPAEMPLPRVCCVLHDQVGPGACPVCPRHDSQARRTLTEEFLRSLGDVDFLAEMGRARITPARR